MTKAANTAESVNKETGEITSFDPSKLKIVKRVTLPILKQRVGQPIYVKILEKMVLSESKGDDKKDPATVCKVYDLEHDRPAQIIVTAVTKSNLMETYPDDSYVGRFFKIELFAVEGKKYHQVELIEFDEPAGFVMKN